MHLRSSCILLAAGLTAAAAADPAIAVDATGLSATAAAGEVLSVPVTITNTGSAPLRFRIRDTGSGLGGPATTARVLATYPVSWPRDPNGFAFDGLGLWQSDLYATSPSRTQFRWTALDDPTDDRIIAPAGLSWKPGLTLAWDGGGLWCASDFTNFVSGQPAVRRLARYLPTGIAQTEIHLGGEVVSAPTPSLPAWDGRRLWLNDGTAFTVDTAAGNQRTATPAVTQRYFLTGKSFWAGHLWGFRLSGNGAVAPATTISRVDPASGAVTNHVIMPAELVTGTTGSGNGVSAQAVDGFGRFIVMAIAGSQRRIVHVDSGLRGWMSCPDATHQRIELAPGASRTITIRMDGSVSGAGAFTSAVWIDSDDPVRRRVVLPVAFQVGTQPPAAPIAHADRWATDRDLPITMAPPGVLGNDRGLAPLTAVVASAPSRGSLVLGADGGFTYRPDPGFVGTDSFTYRAVDGQGRSSPATTATIVVADVPRLAASPTRLELTVPAGGSTSAVITVTNTGGGILRVRGVDLGSGGAPAVVTAIRRVAAPTTSFSGNSFLCFDGQSFWTAELTGTHLIRIDAATGLELGRFPHGLPPYASTLDLVTGLAWVDGRIALLDRGELAPSGGGGYAPSANPRIRFYDADRGVLVSSIEISVGGGQIISVDAGLAWDGDDSLWSHSRSRNATYRTSLRSGTTAVLPGLATSLSLAGLAWYSGDLWAKDRSTIKRFNPLTGALTGTWTWAGSGDTVSTANNQFFGFAQIGGGQVALAAGTAESPRILVADTGMRGWLAIDPPELQVPAGESRSITVAASAAALVPGSYAARIRLLANDVDDREAGIPVTLTVSGTANAGPGISRGAVAEPAQLVLP